MEGLRIKLPVGWGKTTSLACPAGEETSSKVHLKKTHQFKWCSAVFSWQRQGGAGHEQSWLQAGIDTLQKGTARGVRRMVPGATFITTETEQREHKVKRRGDFAEQGATRRQAVSRLHPVCEMKINATFNPIKY